MSDDSAESPLDVLTEEFVERFRRGEQPSLTEYCERYPEYAEEIRELFPSLVLLEKAGLAESIDQSRKVIAEGVGGEQPIGRIGEFRIVREIGRGGMGIVYEAIQESLGRHVALKLLPVSAQSNPRHLQRFQREAKAAARLHHTNIVPVFGIGESEGRYYYTMQFIQGLGLDEVAVEVRRIRRKQRASVEEQPLEQNVSAEALAEALLSGTFRVTGINDAGSCRGNAFCERPHGQTLMAEPIAQPAASEVQFSGQSVTTTASEDGRAYWESVAKIGIQVAEALQYASDQGVLHRDIKPGNLLLDLNGTIWVADFGLAKSEDSDALTNTGDILGTLRYMAPERFEGRSDLRSDIYSLGATLYELLALRPLYGESSRHLLVRQIVEADHGRREKLGAGVPTDLETVVFKSVAKDPKDRYATARELAEDLKRFVEDRPIRARRVSRREQFWKWCRRNPLISSLMTMLTVALFLLVAGSVSTSLILRKERDSALAAQVKSEQAERAGRQALYQALLEQGRSLRATDKAGHRELALASIGSILKSLPATEISADQRAELRDEVIADLALVDSRSVRVDDGGFRGLEGIDVDLDDSLQTIAHASEDYKSTIIRAFQPARSETSPSVERIGLGYLMAARHFDRDGRRLVEIRDAMEPLKELEFRVWDVAAQKIKASQTHSFHHYAFALHPTKDEMFLLGSDERIHVMDIASGTEIRHSPPVFTLAKLALNPDGTQLAVSDRAYTFSIVDSRTWHVIKSLDISGFCKALAWSPTGDYIVFGMIDGQIVVWNVETEVAAVMRERLPAAAKKLTFSPDGRLLAANSAVQQFSVFRFPDQRVLFTMPGQAVRFSGDSREIAVVDQGQLSVHELSPEVALRSAELGAEGFAFSPDGRWIATGGMHGARILPIDDLTSPVSLGLDTCGPPAFHPVTSELITFGQFSQLWRWPMTPSDSVANQWQIGPPEPITTIGSSEAPSLNLFQPQHEGRHVAFSKDGTKLVIANNRKDVTELHLMESGQPLRRIGDLQAVQRVAVSPDGKWAVGSSLRPQRVIVWSLEDGREVLSVWFAALGAFSPDGKQFAACGDNEAGFFRVDDWKRDQSVIDDTLKTCSPALAYHPRETWIAFAPRRGIIRIWSLSQNQIVADLTDPQGRIPATLQFSPDGRSLGFSATNGDVGIWDLQVVRRELNTVGLEAGLLEPILLSSRISPKSHLTVDRGEELSPVNIWSGHWMRLARNEISDGNYADAVHAASKAMEMLPREFLERQGPEILTHRGLSHLYCGNTNAARADWERAIKLAPQYQDASLRLAQLYLCGPTEIRNPQSAVGLLSPLLLSNPEDNEVQTLLGIADFRMGRWSSAIQRLNRGSDGRLEVINRYFLAAALQRNNQPTEASAALCTAGALYDAAIESMIVPERDELRAIRKEIELFFDLN
jgi:serine/threonine protein kinase/WD40 repeat protein